MKPPSRFAQSLLLVMVALQANLVLNSPSEGLVMAFIDPVPIRSNPSLSPYHQNTQSSSNKVFGGGLSSQRFFTPCPNIAMSSHAAGGLMKPGDESNRTKKGGLARKRDKLATVVKSATEQGMRVVSRRPDIEGGQRYRSKDWFINILSLPNSFVLRRIKFHLVTNMVLSALVVLINRYYFRIEIPLVGHTMLGG